MAGAADGHRIERVSDPSRLEMLRFLERYQLQQLEQTRRWISDEERREAEHRRGEQQRPPTPDWVVELGLSGGAPQAVHVGGCAMGGTQARTKPISLDQAVRALADGVRACTFCRPDTELGILD